MAKVSVIVPLYNAAQTLQACARSVLDQSLAPHTLELVLVNDGSTDDSGAVCAALARQDPRVTVAEQANAGVSAARNTGMDRAAGDYFVFLDADDRLLPGALAAALDAQEQTPDRWVIWRYSIGPGDPDFWGAELDRTGLEPLPPAALAQLYRRCFFSMPWNKLYRADWARALRFDPAYTLGEDLLFCLDYLRAAAAQPGFAGFALLHRALTQYSYRQGESSLSTRYLPGYCPLWEGLFDRLDAECDFFACPPQELLALRRDEFLVLAEGAADILRRGPGPKADRRRQARRALQSPAMRARAGALRAARNHSPYLLPAALGLPTLTLAMADSRRRGTRLYGRLDWLGWYLHGGGWARE